MPKFAIKFGLIAGMVGLTPAVHAADNGAIFAPSLSAQILGEVRNSAGVVQMGAVVSLYNRYDELLRRGLSNQDGKFVFDGLAPDVYSIGVSLASFVPAVRRNISVLAGSENLLKIQLASALSTIELVPLNSPEGALMSDSWKWVLRSSHATRPVLRLLPQTSSSPQTNSSGSSSSRSAMASLFSETSGLVKLSAGDGDPFGGNPQDLGTAFVLATSVNGTSKVHVSGNVGYAANGLPSAGFRTTYRRDDQNGEGPQLAMTVRQIYLPSLMGSGAPGSETPALRTASISSYDKMEVLDIIHLEYGVSLESISLFGRMNHVNPFARATYDLGDKSAVQVAVSAGSQPVELIAGSTIRTRISMATWRPWDKCSQSRAATTKPRWSGARSLKLPIRRSEAPALTGQRSTPKRYPTRRFLCRATWALWIRATCCRICLRSELYSTWAIIAAWAIPLP